jgi:hypothetical protein
MAAVGYSGKPLYQKLGLTPGMECKVVQPPADYERLLGDVPPSVILASCKRTGLDVVHVFATGRKQLAVELAKWRKLIQPAGMIWVSWPKKSARQPTDITEDVIREVAFPLDLVDVKVCAVSEVWSGLKLVIRKEKRS